MRFAGLALSAWAVLCLAGCIGTGPDGEQSRTEEKRRSAEILTDSKKERTTSVTIEPLDGPELDDGLVNTVTAGSVTATAPGRSKMSVSVDEREAGSREENTEEDSSQSSIVEQAKRTPLPIYAGGFLLVVAGVVVAVAFGRVVWGLALAGAGVAGVGMVVAFTAYPWIAWLVILLVVGGCAALVYEMWQRKREQKALKTIVGGIEHLGDTGKKQVVSAIADPHRTDQRDREATKAIVQRVKKQIGRG